MTQQKPPFYNVRGGRALCQLFPYCSCLHSVCSTCSYWFYGVLASIAFASRRWESIGFLCTDCSFTILTDNQIEPMQHPFSLYILACWAANSAWCCIGQVRTHRNLLRLERYGKKELSFTNQCGTAWYSHPLTRFFNNNPQIATSCRALASLQWSLAQALTPPRAGYSMCRACHCVLQTDAQAQEQNNYKLCTTYSSRFSARSGIHAGSNVESIRLSHTLSHEDSFSHYLQHV